MATGPNPMSMSTDSDSSSEDEGSNGRNSDSDSDPNSDSASEPDSEPEDVRETTLTQRCHRLKFKCIGSKKEQRYQDALRSAQDVRRLGHTIPVSLFKEPLNPRDAQAIAFKCQLDGKWKTIGYVVSELLDEVHNVMDNGRIISVEFAWISYVTDWAVCQGISSSKMRCRRS